MTTWYAACFFQALLLGTVVGTQIDLRFTAAQSISETHSKQQVQQQKQQKQHDEFAPIILRDISNVHQRSLWICNAYAHPSGLHVYNLGTQQRITDDQPLVYKACMDKKIELRDGDKLDFRSNKRSIGIFRARGLPQSQASLLLIPYRRHPSSISASFDSHAFMDGDASQIVVVDTYRGSQAGKIKIRETSMHQAQGNVQSRQQTEDLQFKSVVSVKPGQYQIFLQSASDTSVSSADLKINSASGKYVVMRVGCEPEAHSPGHKPAFPQELVVYPQNSAGLALQLHSLVLLSVITLTIMGLQL